MELVTIQIRKMINDVGGCHKGEYEAGDDVSIVVNLGAGL